MISTSRISAFSSRVIIGGRPSHFVVADISDGGRHEWHIFQDLPGRPGGPRCVNASPYRSFADALRAVSCLTPV